MVTEPTGVDRVTRAAHLVALVLMASVMPNVARGEFGGFTSPALYPTQERPSQTAPGP